MDEVLVKGLQEMPGPPLNQMSPGLTRNRFGDQSLRIPSTRRDSKHHQINRVRRRSFSEKEDV